MKHSAQYIQSFPVNLPTEKIDLYKWVTEMTDADYRSYSKGHKMMGSFFHGERFFMNIVENIGNETIIQHFELQKHSPEHVELNSAHTQVYVMRWFPTAVSAYWELNIAQTSSHTSELTSLVRIDFANIFQKLGGWLNGLGGFFLNRHIKREGRAFARDIEKKFGVR